MTEFHVEYRIEVEAETARDAVEKVADMLGDGGAARGNYHVMPNLMVIGMPLRPGEIEIDLDPEEQRADIVERPCVECGEEAVGDVGYTFRNGTVMCSGCTHDAYRSGWNGEGSDD